MEDIMKTIISLVLASTLAGCASPHVVHFAEAPRSAPQATVMNAMIVGVAEETQPTLDSIPEETEAAIASPERAHAYAEGFTLAPHQPMAFSFHCVSGEESLGCKAKPAEAFIERDADAIFGD
jgi:hypothetical protein